MNLRFELKGLTMCMSKVSHIIVKLGMLSLVIAAPTISHASDVHSAAGWTSYICNYAVTVTGAGPGAPVYRRPAARSKVIARLPAGAPVYICDENRQWYEVHFNEACAVRSTDGLKSERARLCPVGWMRSSTVEVLSG